MSKGPTQAAASRTNAGQASAAPAVFERLAALAAKGGSRSAYFAGVLRCLASEFASPYAALHARFAAEVVQEDCHAGPTAPKFWRSSVQRFLTESLGAIEGKTKLLKAKSGGTIMAFIYAPIVDERGNPAGGVALVVGPLSDTVIEPKVTRLEGALRLACYLAGVSRGPADAATSARELERAASDAARHAARVANYSAPEELGFGITAEVRNKLSAEMAALGVVQGGHVRILSISGQDEVHHRSPGVAAVRAAMEECVDRAEPIACQREDTWTDAPLASAHRLHRQWQAAARGDAVISLPLRVGDSIAAVLSIRRRADQPFTKAQVDDIRTRVEALVPALALLQRANRGLLRHLRDSIRGGVAALLAPGHNARRVIAAMVAAAVLWFCFGTIPYDLSVPASLVPAHTVYLAAPMAGELTAVQVIEGDHVRKGDLLAAFNVTDLLLERSELAAQLGVLEREQDRASALKSPVDSQLALANQQLIKARLASVDRRITLAEVRAPIDGIIVQGDLRKRVGSLLSLGEPMLTVAPGDAWTVELEVAENKVDLVSGGMPGSFAAFARPSDVHRFRVDRVHPAAQIRGQQNVFVAEAQIGASNPWMKPGMKGIGRVHLGSKPVWWAALHRAIDAVRMYLWT